MEAILLIKKLFKKIDIIISKINYNNLTMSTTIMRTLINIFRTTEPSAKHLGRWALKHDQQACEYYIQNAYAEPGYPNDLKEKWIEVRKLEDEKKRIGYKEECCVPNNRSNIKSP